MTMPGRRTSGERVQSFGRHPGTSRAWGQFQKTNKSEVIMALPITAGAGRIIALPDGNPASLVSSVSSPGPDPTILAVSADLRAIALGTPRQVAAGMSLLGRETSVQMDCLAQHLGETDRSVLDRSTHFIDSGQFDHESINEDFFSEVSRRNQADTEQSPQSRARTILGAGLQLLEKAREPGLNLLNITARTGLIVTLTTVLRQVIGYYVEQAIREGDSPQASQAWNVAAVTMIGPAMSLLGALRDEGAGTANLQTRLGRVCMASITMGSLIAAHLTGASGSMLSTAINTTVYTFARDLCNAFFPLNDNAGPVTAQATGVSMAAFGTVQYLLEQLGALMPLSGPGRAAAGLGWNLGVDVVAGALNSVGAVMDDFVFVLCRSWPLLSPQVGLGPVSVDPESLQQRVLEVRAGVRVPTAQQLGNALFNNGAARTSAFMAIVLAVGAAATELSLTDLGENSQVQLVNVVLGIMMMLIYFPFILSCSQSTPEAKPAAQLQA
jgi:hypothetical protein